MIEANQSGTPKWPQIGQYKEGKHTVRVFKPGYAEGFFRNNVAKPTRKG